MSQKFIIQLSKTIKKEVIKIYEIEAEDKYQAILEMHKKTDEEKQQFLIGGDVLFKQSIGRTDLPFGSHEDLVNNIKKKLWPLPKEVIVYPGHGEPTTIGEEMATNPYLT